MRRLSLPVAIAVVVLLGAAVAAAARPAAKHPRRAPLVVGIADQKPALFSDARFRALGVTRVRRTVAWDALTVPWQVAELTTWMNAARAAGVTPLITFEHSRKPGRQRVLPSPAQLQTQFRALRRLFPWAKEFSTWNEANFGGQATSSRPELVARYYHSLRRACPSCTVLGADLLDMPSMPKWVRRFVRAGGQPAVWGLHNYVTANRFATDRTRALLAVTKGKVWLTETGGIVSRHNKSTIRIAQGKAHAAAVTTFILGRLAAISPRITRAYLYQWNTTTRRDAWDSGLVGPDGRARPALAVLKAALHAHRVRGH